jgi:TetR/AcrR family transcriptional regulator
LTTSKEKILETAIEVFSRKGFHGARMDEIATQSGINKAMIYYYFSTKENLYHDTLKLILDRIFSPLPGIWGQILDTDLSPPEKIRRIAQVQFDNISINISGAKITFEAIVNNPEEVRGLMEEYVCQSGNIVERLLSYIENCITQGIFRPINPKHFLISMIGMNLNYYISKPVLQVFFAPDVQDERVFLQERREHVADLLLRGILEKEN